MLNFDLERIKPTQDIQVCSSLAQAEVAIVVRSLRGGRCRAFRGAVSLSFSSSPSPRSSDDQLHYPYVPFSRSKQLSSRRRFLGTTRWTPYVTPSKSVRDFVPAGGHIGQITSAVTALPSIRCVVR